MSECIVTTQANGDSMVRMIISWASKQAYFDTLAIAPKEIAKLFVQEHKQQIMSALNLNEIVTEIAKAIGESIAKSQANAGREAER